MKFYISKVPFNKDVRKIDIKDFLIERGWELTDKEKALFERATGGLTKDRPSKRPDLERGILLYAFIKRNNLKRALDIGTAGWFSALSMAIAGAWVVTLDVKPTSPGNWGVFNAYRDRVFQVVQRSQDYLNNRDSTWDIIFIDGDHFYEAVKRDCELVKGKFRYLLCHDYGNIGETTKAINEVLGPPETLIITDRRWFGAPYEEKPLSDFDYGIALYEKT